MEHELPGTWLGTCKATYEDGTPCRNAATKGEYCGTHRLLIDAQEGAKTDPGLAQYVAIVGPGYHEAAKAEEVSTPGACLEFGAGVYYFSVRDKAGDVQIGKPKDLQYVSVSRNLPDVLLVVYQAIASYWPFYCRTAKLYAALTEILSEATFSTTLAFEGKEPETFTSTGLDRRVVPGPPPWSAPEPPAEAPKRPRARRAPAKVPIDEGRGYLVNPADRINAAAIASFTPGAMREELSREVLRQYGIPAHAPKMWRAYPFVGNESKQLGAQNTVSGMIGLPEEPEEAIWELLQKNGALAVKAQYALWARAYAETDAAPGVWVVMSIPQFCDDLGYKRKDGSHQLTNKQQAMGILRLLMKVEVCCFFAQPAAKGKQPKTSILHGPLWSRGIARLDGYADLFGSQQEGDPSLWDPTAFSYAPGPWFADPTWHKFNRNVALVGAGLLTLDSRKDQWPIMVGGYLGTLARTGGYAPRTVRAATLLTKSGLANSTAGGPGRQRKQLERALDRITEMQNPVIGGWEWAGTDATEPDMDDHETLATLADLEKDDWRLRSLVIRWPADMAAREWHLRANRDKKREEESRRITREREENERKRLSSRQEGRA